MLANISSIPYKHPSMLGYCSIDKTGRRHEHCRCSNDNKGIDDCKKQCDTDSECRGYSFRAIKSRCYLYTTSFCSSVCIKRGKGKVGRLLERKDVTESGCFIKEQSKADPMAFKLGHDNCL